MKTIVRTLIFLGTLLPLAELSGQVTVPQADKYFLECRVEGLAPGMKFADLPVVYINESPALLAGQSHLRMQVSLYLLNGQNSITLKNPGKHVIQYRLTHKDKELAQGQLSGAASAGTFPVQLPYSLYEKIPALPDAAKTREAMVAYLQDLSRLAKAGSYDEMTTKMAGSKAVLSFFGIPEERMETARAEMVQGFMMAGIEFSFNEADLTIIPGKKIFLAYDGAREGGGPALGVVRGTQIPIADVGPLGSFFITPAGVQAINH